MSGNDTIGIDNNSLHGAYRSGAFVARVDWEPQVIAVALHALLDRVFGARANIVIATSARLRVVDVSGVDVERHTLADLGALIKASPVVREVDIAAGHLVSDVESARHLELIERFRPLTAMHIGSGEISVALPKDGDVEVRDVVEVMSGAWAQGVLARAEVVLQEAFTGPSFETRFRADEPDLFVTRFVQMARDYPSRIAIETATKAISYAELDRTADGIAADLEQRSVRAGETLLLVPNRDETLVATFVAALKAGITVSIADPEAPTSYIEECARVAGADHVADLAGVGIAGAFTALGLESAVEPERYEAERFRRDDCAIITFTSGTSGTPKAVRGRYGSLTYFFDWMDSRFGSLRGARFGMCSSIGHDPLQRDIMTPLYLGGTIVVPEHRNSTVTEAFPRWLAEHRVQVVCVNPAAIRLLAGAEDSLSDLDVVFLVGAALTRAQVKTVARVAPGARIVNLYGSTETQRAVGYFEVDTSAAGLAGVPEVIPVGRGMKDVDVLVVTPGRRVCLPMQTGQIVVRSSQVALGYAGDAELTASKFCTGIPEGSMIPAYLTGDLGYRSPRHGVMFGGRADHQVKINGYRIELDHISEKCRTMPAVKDAATIGFELDGATALAVFLVPVDDSIRFEPMAFRASLAARVPKYMLPQRVLTVTGMPMTRNGKVDVAALRAMLSEPRPSGDAAATGTEAQIRDYLRYTTGLDEPDMNVPFDALGIDSLRFAALLSRVAGPGASRAGMTNALTAAELVEALFDTGARKAAAPASSAPTPAQLDVRALLGPAAEVSETTIHFRGRRFDHLCSNSYLGLNSHPEIRAAMVEFARSSSTFGSHGSGAINGYTLVHQRLTDALRSLLQCEAVTLYSSGYLANVSAIPAIAGPDDALFIDERCHRSLLDGCLLSGAALHIYRHNDPDDLRGQLQRFPTRGRRVIVSEAIFGVGGDIADLPALVDCARAADAVLFVDEASSVGQLGPGGRGIEAHYGMPGSIDVRVGSLAKAFVGGGGFVTSSGEYAEQLHRHRGATFSTVISPMAAALAAESVELLLREGDTLMARLATNRTTWTTALHSAGFDTGVSATAIVPLLFPDAGDTARWFHAALDADVFLLPLSGAWSSRPGGALRSTVTAAHDPEVLIDVADRLRRAGSRLAATE
ncbi:aminotransferase class I/II-fold pyridoxal phosphate-dependent enzyme [Nocardia ninae]|uniref:Aminotransferase class I/II-fold pyridoxal phosphate-dependent enzyme n=1 Tax=Nocardia ninae NBRC 108245 TaxID=1210091 RepID=A0A511MQI8_9NOCA|nr:aminotransferase class I/II-fold pyridoxal phosphate-dependent enzyme [Nocardia ninae]GEM42850.1 hypothetical protein NN4_73690 [Nocardia ninae NBRC 108245]